MGGERRGTWARMAGHQLNFGVVGNQLAVKGDTDTLQIGSDLLQWGSQERGRVGAMAGAGRSSNRIVSELDGYRATGRVRGNALGLYASWLPPTEGSGLYLDAWAQHARFRHQIRGDALPTEDYRSRANSVSFEAGYGVALMQMAHSSLMLEPQLQLTYADAGRMRHTEANGTVVEGVDTGGLGGRLGVRLSARAPASTANTVEPFAEVQWLHGANAQGLRFNGELLEGALPRDRYEARAGAQLRFGERWTAWGDLGVQRAQDNYREVMLQVGMRANW